MAVDPVCKMEVDENNPPFESEYKGKKYYFCAPSCKKMFEEHPAEYVKE